MNYSIVTQPSVEPLTLSEVKIYLRVDGTTEDNLITALIVAARQHIENYTWRPLCTQTWNLNLDYSEVKEYIGVSKAPVQSITHIKYFDATETQQTVSTGDYQSDVINEPARIHFYDLPSVYDRMNTMEIRFVCGYGVAASVPDAIKEAMYMLIGHWYQHREAVVPTGSGGMREVPMGVEALLNPYRNSWFFPY